MELEQIEGTVEDIIYENPDNGYTVFEISGGGTVTVVCGIVGELHAGESVVCRGKYENHATYGRQFHAQECETDMPKDLEAVYAFLASGSLPYIGARTAMCRMNICAFWLHACPVFIINAKHPNATNLQGWRKLI